MNRLERAGPILALIRKHESDGAAAGQGVPSAYDVVWGGIAPDDRPRRLSAMTAGRVLWWQNEIDPHYMSEAAGAYQILEDTLRSLEPDQTRIFDASYQDELGLQLLDRRGWARCEAGTMSVPDFADQLAREWASMPVTRPQKGHTRPVRAGQSYYVGDGLNKASATVAAVTKAIRDALALEAPEPVAPENEVMAWLRDAPPGLREWLARMPPEVGA